MMTEATAVVPEGRISPEDLGIWSDAHAEALRPVTEFIRTQGAISAIQLAHAGRKAGTYRPWSPIRGFVPLEDGGWAEKMAPSAVAFREGAPLPVEMTRSEIHQLVVNFTRAAERSLSAGFDVVEQHSAHGYLLHQFLSPISNRREDEYGGDWAGRTRLHHELVEAVRGALPEQCPLFMRISATDWVDGAWSLEDTLALARSLGGLGLDLMDCSSGGSTPDASIPVGPGYQVSFAEAVRNKAGVLSGAVGGITEATQADEIIAKGRADLVFLGRELLREPYWAQKAAVELGVEPPWPDQYRWAVG